MTGRKEGLMAKHAGLSGFKAAIPAAVLAVFFCGGPVLAQPAPQPGPRATLPAGGSPVSPAEAVPSANAPAPAPQASAPTTSAGPSAEAASPPPRLAEALLPSALPRDLSPWGMFLTARVPVKLVMIGLAFASLATWTVWLAKTIELWSAKRLARRGLAVLANATSLRAAEKLLAQQQGRAPMARFATAAAGEAGRSDGLAPEGIKDRAATLLSRIEAQAGRGIMRGTGVLATIGATAPFVGLFGTVWGIMDSFIGISKTNTTNLAVVAPGIAEALLATAMGLIAAIPAVVMYNAFARAITSYRAQLGDAAAEVLRHLSRDLDRETSLQREACPQKDAAPVVPLRESAE
jgi:biopolymer transport protein ExbB